MSGNEFPSSVSCVSECVATESVVESEILPSESTVTLLPPLYPVLQAIAPEFMRRFPEFRIGAPQYKENTFIYIAFIYSEQGIPRHAIMVYEVKKAFGRYKVSFNPFLSTPQPHQRNGIEWIQLYFIEFEPAFYALEQAIEKFYNLNPPDIILKDE